MGTSRDVINRIDTSAGSAHSPKVIELGTGANTKELTKIMRKTNFVLGFKSDTSYTRESLTKIPRTITVISEEEEPPASVIKNAAQNPKFKLASIQVKKNTNLPGIRKQKDNVHLGSMRSFQPRSTNQDTYKCITGNGKESFHSISKGFEQLNSMKELQSKTNFHIGFDRDSQTKSIPRDSNEVLKTSIAYWKQRLENKYMMNTGS